MNKYLLYVIILLLISIQAKSSVWIILLDSTKGGKVDTVQHFLYNAQIKKYAKQNLETKEIHYDASLTKIPFASPDYQYKMTGKSYSPIKGWINELLFEVSSDRPQIQRDLSNCGGGLDFILVVKRKTKWYKKAEKMIIRMDLINQEYTLNIVFKPGTYFFSVLNRMVCYHCKQEHPYDLTPKNWDKFKINKEQLYIVSRKYVTNPFEE